MPRYKIQEYCSVIDVLRWLAFDVEPVSPEDEKILVSRKKRKPLDLSSVIIKQGCALGRERYGSDNTTLPSLTEDEIKLKERIPDLKDLLKHYTVDICAILFTRPSLKDLARVCIVNGNATLYPQSIPKYKKLHFSLKDKNIFVETKNPQQYELGYSKERKVTIDGKEKITCVNSTFYNTKINFFQLRKAAQKRLEEESADIELTNCQTRKKAVKEFIKTLPSMSIPEAVKKIQNHFYKCNEDRGWNYKTLANQLKEIKNSDGFQKFPNAPQGNYRKNKQENSRE